MANHLSLYPPRISGASVRFRGKTYRAVGWTMTAPSSGNKVDPYVWTYECVDPDDPSGGKETFVIKIPQEEVHRRATGQ